MRGGGGRGERPPSLSDAALLHAVGDAAAVFLEGPAAAGCARKRPGTISRSVLNAVSLPKQTIKQNAPSRMRDSLPCTRGVNIDGLALGI